MEESRELVRQAKKGKREAFAKLYETVYEDMYRFALYVLKDREDAEELWQRLWQMRLNPLEN